MRAWCKPVSVAAALASAAGAAPARAGVLWDTGAEPNAPVAWEVQQEAQRERVRGDASRAAEGAASFRFELRDGERRSGDPEEIERAELAVATAPDGSKVNLRAGETVAIAWSQFFARTFPVSDELPEDEWCVFFQLKESKDTGSPLISMSCGEGHQALALGKEHDYARPYRERIVRGRWQRFVLRVHLSTGPDGWIELSRDGKQVARAEGQTIRPDTDVYLKAGIYRNAAVEGTAVAYADAFRLRTATADAAPEPPVLGPVAVAVRRVRDLF